MPDINSVPIAVVTKTAPFDEGGTEIASSGVISNVTEEHRSAVVTVIFTAMVPNTDDQQVGYKLHVQLEERVSESPEAWIPRAATGEIDSLVNEGMHVLFLRPGSVINPGTPDTRKFVGGKMLIWNEQGTLPPYYRIRLVKKITNTERDDLQSVTFVAYLRTYNLIPSG